MNWSQILGASISVFLRLLNIWLDRKAERKKEKLRCIDDACQGIKSKDAAKITLAFDRFNAID